MPAADIQGITTWYDVLGSGPPLLMFAPGGFDATADKWSTQGIYGRIKPLDHLKESYTCIVFDRRETGRSGGRVERVSWREYAQQAKGLLGHLGIARAHVMGGCMGCSVAMAFGTHHPQATLSLTLWWPVGGPWYRLKSHLRFAQHLAYVQEHGLDGVVALARAEGSPFGKDPRGGPWATLIHQDSDFAEAYARQDVDAYTRLVAGMGRILFDRDTSPGAEPEDMSLLDVPVLVVPGQDQTHATSAARYVSECFPKAEYWDVPVKDQTAETGPPRILDFLKRAAAI